MQCPICGTGEVYHEFLEGVETFQELMCNNDECPSADYGVLCWLSEFKSQNVSDKFLDKYIENEIIS